MSNNWYYRVVLPKQNILIRETLEIAASTGYHPINISSGQASIWDNKGNFQQFSTLQDTIAHLETHGGYLELFKGTFHDIGIGFPSQDGPENITNAWFTVTGGSFGEKSEDRHQIADEMKGMFVTLCEHLDAPYGYVADELTMEMLLITSLGEIEECVGISKPPPYLFWLNYFSNGYLQSLPPVAIDFLSYDLHVAPGGKIALLSAYPFDTSREILRSKNADWRKALTTS